MVVAGPVPAQVARSRGNRLCEFNRSTAEFDVPGGSAGAFHRAVEGSHGKENFGAPPPKVAWAGCKGSVFGVSSFPVEPQHQVVTGVVQRGDARGRLLGFPTANLTMTTSAHLDGVWSAVVVTEDDGRHWPAAVSIGRRTTFYGRHGQLLLEAHLLDVEIELYDREISVHLVGRLRPQRRFQDVEDLVGQLARDIEDVRNWATSVPLEAGAQ